jgi:hypothetical protein
LGEYGLRGGEGINKAGHRYAGVILVGVAMVASASGFFNGALFLDHPELLTAGMNF